MSHVDTRGLAERIRLNPRAVILVGSLHRRSKLSNKLKGLTPHYAMSGCPEVQYRDDGTALSLPNGAEIEFDIEEWTAPLRAANGGSPSVRPSIVQLVFGGRGLPPSQAEYRILREAGSVIDAAIAHEREDFVLVALPLVTPAQYGMSGRYYFLGLFAVDGHPIFLNPAAVQEGFIECPWPEAQQERAAADVVDGDSWYDEVLAVAAELTSDPERLRAAAVKARARALRSAGLADLDAEMKAAADVDRIVAARRRRA